MKNSWRWTIAVLGLIVIVSVTGTTAQRGGSGRGRGSGGFDRARMQEMRTKMEALRACPIDGMWATLSFEIEMTEEQRVEVAATMKEAWINRRDVLSISEEHDAWDEGRRRMRDLKKKTDARVKVALEKDQWKAYEKAFKKVQKSMRAEMPGRY